jgi:hypothetical protein
MNQKVTAAFSLLCKVKFIVSSEVYAFLPGLVAHSIGGSQDRESAHLPAGEQSDSESCGATYLVVAKGSD